MLIDAKSFKKERTNTKIILPEYPKNWKPTKDFPNLSSVKSLAIDTETYDPELLTHGPGWGRNIGHIVGISIATKDCAWYFPVAHEVQSELNLPKQQVINFCKDVFEKRDTIKIFANAMYDIGWLRTENINVQGKIYDIQFAEPLIDDTARSYSLEDISNKYLEEGKQSEELYEWSARAYGGVPDGKQRANIYRSPPSLVGPYAETDARNPFDILNQQWKELIKYNLLDVFKLECGLIPLLVDIRWRGMCISEEKANIAKFQLTDLIEQRQREINTKAGFKVNVNSPKDLEQLYSKNKIDFLTTPKGNPSFQKGWLEQQADPFSIDVVDIRRFTKAKNHFIQGSILDKHTNGRVHPQIHPLRGEGGGAITGRFSVSAPPMQQIPSRDKELTPIVRGCFMPEEGMEWVKADYSSIELRIFAHFSNNEPLIKTYTDDPFMDYHDYVSKSMFEDKVPRAAIKQFNFSLLYGGGVPTIKLQLSRLFNIDERIQLIKRLGYKVLSNPTEQLAVLFINLYKERFPIISDKLNEVSNLAAQAGEIRTILNRRTSFNKWEPKRKKGIPVSYDQAVKFWGFNDIQRAWTYKALNYRIQGSAADLLKSALLQAYNEGLFNKIPIHGTVHDEFCLSYHPDLNNEFTQLREIAETAIKFNVPIIMDMEHGPSWAEAKTPLELGTRRWIL